MIQAQWHCSIDFMADHRLYCVNAVAVPFTGHNLWVVQWPVLRPGDGQLLPIFVRVCNALY